MITQGVVFSLGDDPPGCAVVDRVPEPSMMHEHANIDIDIIERDAAVVVVVEGEVDLCAAPEFEQSLVWAGATEAPSIVVDLDRVSFMDSAGAHVLLQFSLSEANRGRVTLTRGSPQVRRLLEATGVRRYLTFVSSPGLGAR